MNNSEIIILTIGAYCSMVTYIAVTLAIATNTYKDRLKRIEEKLDLILKAESNS